MQLFADLRDGVGDEVSFFVKDADFYGPLAAALDLPTDSCLEHGPTADGFSVVSFVVKPQIEIRPVVKQDDEVGHEPTGGEFARGGAAASLIGF